MNDQYKLGKIIAKTEHSIVQEAVFNDPSIRPLVIKRMNLDHFPKIDVVAQEITIMNSIRHPNLMAARECFTHENEVWIVMPKYDYSLADYVQPTGCRDHIFLGTVFQRILSGLNYLHQLDIIHRDIKGPNILISQEGEVVLADFGVSKHCNPCLSGSSFQTTSSFVGTPCWMSPEICESKSYNYKTDIWSLGITLIEAYFGQAPYSKYPGMKVILLIIKNPPPVPDKSELGNTMHKFINACLQLDPEKRSSADKLLNFKFIKNNNRSNQHLAKIIKEHTTIDQVQDLQ